MKMLKTVILATSLLVATSGAVLAKDSSYSYGSVWEAAILANEESALKQRVSARTKKHFSR